MQLPSSMVEYVNGILEVLPKGCVSPELQRLGVFTFEKAYPDEGESLDSWVSTAARNTKDKLPLTMILGESRSINRQPRQPVPLGQSQGPLLNMACTCDGAGGTRALIGLLRNSHISLDDLYFDARIDEWNLRNPKIPQRVKESHLIVLGTPEVNIFATFLHGLVKEFHYGRDVWPPDLSSAGDRLLVCGNPYLRSPYGGVVNDCGGVFLLRNPWNPDYRILWIGGLTGWATWHGCSLIASGWNEHIELAKVSIGVVFGRDILGHSKEISPRYWLIYNKGAPAWRSSSKLSIVIEKENDNEPEKSEERAISKSLRDGVFISYSHQDEVWLNKFLTHLKPLVKNKRLYVWADSKIETGSKWRGEIENAILRAKVAVLLVSPEFLASDFIADNELPPILNAAENKDLTIIWIPVSSSSYSETSIDNYQAAHNPSKPLDMLSNPARNKALVAICRKIAKAAK